MKRTLNWHWMSLVLLVLATLAMISACASSENTPTDGDVAEDGDVVEDGDTDGDAADGDSVIDGDDADNPCGQGREFDEELGMCVPKKKECATGFKLDESINMCVPKTEWDYALEGCSTENIELGEQTARYFVEEDERWWTYTGYEAGETPTEKLDLYNFKTKGGPSSPAKYPLTETETSMATCIVCVVLSTDCTADENGHLICNKTFMPSGRGDGVVEFTRLDNANEGTLSGKIRNVEMREVTIGDDNTTTPVEGGETRCLTDVTFKGQLPAAGFVEMDPPAGLTCDYPEGPYFFIGPEPDKAKPWPGTVPPMSWPGAYINDERVGFNLAQYRCDHPEVKTLFIMTSAGWCPACRQFYGGMVCPEGELEDQLYALSAEILYVVGDTNTPGQMATNEFANDYMNGKGCKRGIRISDSDNTAKKRVIWYTPMSSGIPWVSVVRMSDMKLIYEQGDTYYLDFTGIAQDVLDEEAEQEAASYSK